MRILVLNGSPRSKGNTKQMVDAFREGAESAGHRVRQPMNGLESECLFFSSFTIY